MSEECTSKSVVWHPDIHQHYSEELFYYLIRSTGYFPEFKSGLLDLLSERSIRGFCLYDVFGDFDFMLRVWLTPQKREDLTKAFRDKAYRVSEFVVREFVHLWHVQKDGSLTSRNFTDVEISKVGSAKLMAAQEGDETAQDELFANGMLLCHVPKRDGFKFFTRLNLATGHLVDERAITEALIACIRGAGYLRQPSAYRGMGFAQFLIKGVVDSFYQVEEFVFDLLDAFRIAGGATTTYVVSDSEPLEYDAVNFPTDAIQRDTVTRLVPEMSGPEGSGLGTLEKAIVTMAILDNLAAFEADSTKTDGTGTLHDLCAEFIRGASQQSQDRSRLEREFEPQRARVMAFLAGAEDRLRTIRSQALPAFFHEKAPAAHEEILRKCGLRSSLSSMGDSSSYLQSLYACAGHELSSETRRALKRAVELRNVLMHGDQALPDTSIWRFMVDVTAGLVLALKEMTDILDATSEDVAQNEGTEPLCP
jgi:hypothetical protein